MTTKGTSFISIGGRIGFQLARHLNFFLRDASFFVKDWIESVLGTRDRKVPPRGLNYNMDFNWSHLRTKSYEKTFYSNSCTKEIPFYIKELDLKPESYVLDYGCGLGRAAYAFDKYLSSEGLYLGVDIVENTIQFLQSAYKDKPNFQFKFLPLKVDHYVDYLNDKKEKSEKKLIPSKMKIDSPDRYFDYQISVSVFTHMYEEDIISSLKELGRVTKSGGYCINTWLVVDDYAKYILKCGLADRALPYEKNGMFYYYLKNPLMCTGYSLEKVKSIYERAGQKITSIRYGSWAGRENHAIYQDIVISQVL